jgi:hypothetical protein
MAAFYQGPPVRVPGGAYHCQIGRFGWPGRALRNSSRLVVNNLAASVVTLTASAVMGALFFQVSSTDGGVAKTLTTVVGALVGVAIGVGIVAIYQWSPLGRRQHWRVSFSTFQDGTVGIWLRSQHWHTVRDLRLEIVDPDKKQTVIADIPAASSFNQERRLGGWS